MNLSQPGLGVYPKDNEIRLKDIYHKPIIGYNKINGEWCPICKLNNKFSCVEPGEECEVCHAKE